MKPPLQRLFSKFVFCHQMIREIELESTNHCICTLFESCLATFMSVKHRTSSSDLHAPTVHALPRTVVIHINIFTTPLLERTERTTLVSSFTASSSSTNQSSATRSTSSNTSDSKLEQCYQEYLVEYKRQ